MLCENLFKHLSVFNVDVSMLCFISFEGNGNSAPCPKWWFSLCTAH